MGNFALRWICLNRLILRLVSREVFSGTFTYSRQSICVCIIFFRELWSTFSDADAKSEAHDINAAMSDAEQVSQATSFALGNIFIIQAKW